MQKQRGFTLMELLVVIGIIALLVGLLFPALAAVQNTAKKNENNAQVRKVIQAMIQSSEARRGFFPGISSPTEFTQVDWDDDNTLEPVNGSDPAVRYWILLDGNYIDGASLFSPRETKEPWSFGEVTTEHYSFAMLKIADNNNFATTTSPNDRYRREEWRNEQNALAPVVTDRLAETDTHTSTSLGDPTTYLSIHPSSSIGEWHGSVGRGDLSVEFIETAEVSTRISGYNNVDNDDIFDDAAPTGSTEGLKNAAMTYDGYDDPVGPFE